MGKRKTTLHGLY